MLGTELDMLGPVNLTHAATGQQRLDDIGVAEHRPGRESARSAAADNDGPLFVVNRHCGGGVMFVRGPD